MEMGLRVEVGFMETLMSSMCEELYYYYLKHSIYVYYLYVMDMESDYK